MNEIRKITGAIIAIVVIALLVTLPFVLSDNIAPTEIELTDDHITLKKGDVSQTIYIEDIVSVSLDPNSVLVEDANTYYYVGTDNDRRWDSEKFYSDYYKITGHRQWLMSSTSNDNFGEGKEASKTVKLVTAHGADLFLAYTDNPSLITIKTSYDRYMFLNDVSVEETEMLYERLVALTSNP